MVENGYYQPLVLCLCFGLYRFACTCRPTSFAALSSVMETRRILFVPEVC